MTGAEDKENITACSSKVTDMNIYVTHLQQKYKLWNTVVCPMSIDRYVYTSALAIYVIQMPDVPKFPPKVK